MGNALVCDAAPPPVDWTCGGIDAPPAACTFPFSLVLADGTERVFDGCVSNAAVSAPGALVAAEFWCASNATVTAGAASGLVHGCGCEVEEDKTWLLGILFAVLSSFCTTTGIIMQKIAHNINNAKPAEKRAPEFIGILLSPYWLGAFLLMVMVPLPFDLISFTLASQSLLVPFAGLSLVLNQIMAPYVLGEKLDRIEIIATAIILVGLVITTTTGSRTDAALSACQIIDRYSDADFLGAVTVLLGLVSVCLFVIHGVGESLLSRARPFCFAFCAGGFAGIGNIMMKATGELVADGISSGEGGAWTTIHPYYHILLMIAFSTMQISYLNRGLRKYDAVLFIPLYSCLYILLSGTMGAITYREFDNYSQLQVVLFPVGVFITSLGIMVMSQKAPAADQDLKVRPVSDPEAGSGKAGAEAAGSGGQMEGTTAVEACDEAQGADDGDDSAARPATLHKETSMRWLDQA